MIVPILVLAALGIGAYALKKSADANAAAAAGATSNAQLAAAPVTATPPLTGPQELTRDQKIAFFKVLPQLSVVEDVSKTTFDTGRLQPSSQMIAPSEKAAAALALLYRASMMGHAVLVGKDGSDTMVLVPAVNTEAGFSAPGSDWHIVLDPMEADAIASAAGVAIPADVAQIDMSRANGDLNLNPLFRSAGAAQPSPASPAPPSPSNIGSFTPIAGNPFRQSVSSLLSIPALTASASLISALAPKSNAVLDYTKVPGTLGQSAAKAVASNDSATLVAWADALLKGGYNNAAQQLYKFARSAGWAPTDDDPAHFQLMTLDEMLASPHGRLQAPYAGWEDDILARRLRAHTAPMPDDGAVLDRARLLSANAGYSTAAAELAAIVAALGGGLRAPNQNV